MPEAMENRNGHKLISIPDNLGTIRQAFQGSNKIIFCIQDLHCNYEVQKNISGIIHHLAQNNGLKLVGEEGANCRLKLGVLRDFPVRRISQAVSNYFVKHGRLTGAEHYAAVGANSIRLEGIESPDLYAQSYAIVRQFLNFESQGYIYDLRDLLDRLKPRIYNPKLQQHEMKCWLYRQGKLDLKKYSFYLQNQARSLQNKPGVFLELPSFLELRQNAFPSEIHADEKYYKDLEQLDSRIRQYFYTTTEQQELDQLYANLDIIEKVLNISAAPDEVNTLQNNKAEFVVARFAEFIQQQAREQWQEEFYLLDRYLAQALEFYRLADQRSITFVDNMLARMQETNESMALMISGGYHIAKITQELKRRNIGFLAIEPRLTQQDVVNPYFNLLQGKRLPLEILLKKNQSVMSMPSWPENETLTFNRYSRMLQKSLAPDVVINDIFEKPKPLMVSLPRNHQALRLVEVANSQEYFVLVGPAASFNEKDIQDQQGTLDFVEGFGIAVFKKEKQLKVAAKALFHFSQQQASWAQRQHEKIKNELAYLVQTGRSLSQQPNQRTFAISHELQERNLYPQVRVALDRFRKTRTWDLVLNWETLNVMGILAHQAADRNDRDEIATFEKLLATNIDFQAAVQSGQAPMLRQFVLRLQNDDFGVEAAQIGMLEEIRQLSPGESKVIQEYSSADIVPNDFLNMREAVAVIKPPVAASVDTVKAVLDRIRYAGYQVVAAVALTGAHFIQHPEFEKNFYQTNKGYDAQKIPLAVLKSARKHYNTAVFEFLLEESFDDSMVIPAAQLISRFGMTEDKITELWNVCRTNISVADFKVRFNLDAVDVLENGIHLQRGDRNFVLPLEANDGKPLLTPEGNELVWGRRTDFGVTELVPSWYGFPIKVWSAEGNKYRTIIIINGYYPALMKLFRETPETRTIGLVVRGLVDTSMNWEQMREFCLGGNSNPHRNPCGSVRRDAALGELPLPINPADPKQFNVQRNVQHLSSSALEGLGEMVLLFGMPLSQTIFGKSMLAAGFSEAYIKFLLTNPVVRFWDADRRAYVDQNLFDLLSKKEPGEALRLIQRYYQPFMEYTADPQDMPTIGFAQFLDLQQAYLRGSLERIDNPIPETEISTAVDSPTSFQTAVEEAGMRLPELDRDGLAMVQESQLMEIVPVAGTAGRFFGRKTIMPEGQKVKALAPIWRIDGKLRNSFEVKLLYLRDLIRRAGGGKIPFYYVLSEKNAGYVDETVRALCVYPDEDLIALVGRELPRLNPRKTDLKFSGEGRNTLDYMLPKGNDEDENIATWLKDNGEPGDFFRNDDGTISSTPFGHFNVLANFVLSKQLLRAAQNGVQVLHITNGDDVAGLLDPAKAAYLMKNPEIDALALLVEKNTVFAISRKHEIFQELKLPKNMPEEFAIVARGGQIISHNLPVQIQIELKAKDKIICRTGDKKVEISGKQEKGGSYVHVKSVQRDLIVDQPVAGQHPYYSSNQFYLKISSLLERLGLSDLNTYANMTPGELMEKIGPVFSQVPTRVRIKAVNVGNYLVNGQEVPNMRPAASVFRNLGEGITQLFAVQPILIDRDGKSGREGCSSVKAPQDVAAHMPTINRLLGLDANGNPESNCKLDIAPAHRVSNLFKRFFRKFNEKTAGRAKDSGIILYAFDPASLVVLAMYKVLSFIGSTIRIIIKNQLSQKSSTPFKLPVNLFLLTNSTPLYNESPYDPVTQILGKWKDRLFGPQLWKRAVPATANFITVQLQEKARETELRVNMPKWAWKLSLNRNNGLLDRIGRNSVLFWLEIELWLLTSRLSLNQTAKNPLLYWSHRAGRKLFSVLGFPFHVEKNSMVILAKNRSSLAERIQSDAVFHVWLENPDTRNSEALKNWLVKALLEERNISEFSQSLKTVSEMCRKISRLKAQAVGVWKHSQEPVMLPDILQKPENHRILRILLLHMQGDVFIQEKWKDLFLPWQKITSVNQSV